MIVLRIALGWALLAALFGTFIVLAVREAGWRVIAALFGIVAAVVVVALAAGWLITGRLS